MIVVGSSRDREQQGQGEFYKAAKRAHETDPMDVNALPMNCKLNHSLDCESRKSVTYVNVFAFQVLFQKFKIRSVFVP